jgi:molecular chaperone DnaK (HSP70)
MASKTAFGIDFGTTNTRIAYFDGEKLFLVPVYDSENSARSWYIPSMVAYSGGEPVAYGYDARDRKKGQLPPDAIKWLLAQENLVEIDGVCKKPVEIAADFFRYLKKVVENVKMNEPLTSAAITIPVNYPLLAQKNLCLACQDAGIEVTHLFPEPVAALYCAMLSVPGNGVSAVFDWGGGTLDVATVQVENGLALVKKLDGIKRGGQDFDELICRHALDKFYQDYPSCPIPRETILASPAGKDLRLKAEMAKMALGKLSKTKNKIDRMSLWGSMNLQFTLSEQDFQGWIAPDVEQALKCLLRTIKSSGITPVLLAFLEQRRKKQRFQNCLSLYVTGVISRP